MRPPVRQPRFGSPLRLHLLVLLLAGATPASGQIPAAGPVIGAGPAAPAILSAGPRSVEPAVAFTPLETGDVASLAAGGRAAFAPDPRRAALAVAASALMPGAGQRMLGLDRWVLYGAAEAWAWLTWAQDRRDGRTLERQYRDLAWQVARRVSTGDRRDGDFEYYESMEHYGASGAYDADPARPGVQPEADPFTYNGQTWRLARELYLGGGATAVDSAAALAYYAANATPPELAWSWGDNDLEQQLFASLIHHSDEGYRSAKTMLGVILANHVVSAIDAFVVSRLGGQTAGAARIRLAPAPPLGGRSRVGISIAIPVPEN